MLKYILLLIAPWLAMAGDPKFEPAIAPGQCRPDVFSKVYLPADGTPILSFTCTFHCLDNAGVPQVIKGVLHQVDRARSEIDGSLAVCDGARVIQKSSGSGVRFWDFDQVVPFWAPESGRPEIRKFVKIDRVKVPEPYRTEKFQQFRRASQEVGSAYGRVPREHAHFHRAAQVILEMAGDTAVGRAELRGSIQRLRSGTARPSNTWEGLVDAHVRTQIPFLVGEAE